MKAEFLVRNQYKKYLALMELKEAEMHPQQRLQLKQAFFGAWGQLLMTILNEWNRIPSEKERGDIMDAMVEEVGQYWKDQKDNHEKNEGK